MQIITCDINDHAYPAGYIPQTRAVYKVSTESGSKIDVCEQHLVKGIQKMFNDPSYSKTVFVEKI